MQAHDKLWKAAGVVFALAISAWTGWNTRENGVIEERLARANEVIARTSESVNALAFRPILRLTEDPEILSASLDSYTVVTGPQHDKAYIGGGVVPMRIRMKVRNEEKPIATIEALVVGDTVPQSGGYRDRLLLRREILDTSATFNEANAPLVVRLNELLKEDTTFVQFDYTARHIRDGKIVLHILVVYTNELKALYDTYTLAEYEINVPITFAVHETRGPVVIVDRTEFQHRLRLIGITPSYQTYTERAEADRVRKRLRIED